MQKKNWIASCKLWIQRKENLRYNLRISICKLATLRKSQNCEKVKKVNFIAKCKNQNCKRIPRLRLAILKKSLNCEIETQNCEKKKSSEIYSRYYNFLCKETIVRCKLQIQSNNKKNKNSELWDINLKFREKSQKCKTQSQN